MNHLNKDLLLPYVAPYLAYVTIASILKNQLAPEWNYALRLAVVTPLLLWGWKRYVSFVGPNNPLVSVVVGIAAGLLGTFLWVVSALPFVEDVGGVKWSGTAFAFRFVAAGFLVPILEELLMRGYVLRLAYQWDVARKARVPDPFATVFHEQSIDGVVPGSWTVAAVAIATVIFALGHEAKEWPASVIYGSLMASLWIVRKDLLSCIIAHGVTNICLAVYIRTNDYWGLW